MGAAEQLARCPATVRSCSLFACERRPADRAQVSTLQHQLHEAHSENKELLAKLQDWGVGTSSSAAGAAHAHAQSRGGSGGGSGAATPSAAAATSNGGATATSEVRVRQVCGCAAVCGLPMPAYVNACLLPLNGSCALRGAPQALQAVQARLAASEAAHEAATKSLAALQVRARRAHVYGAAPVRPLRRGPFAPMRSLRAARPSHDWPGARWSASYTASPGCPKWLNPNVNPKPNAGGRLQAELEAERSGRAADKGKARENQTLLAKEVKKLRGELAALQQQQHQVRNRATERAGRGGEACRAAAAAPGEKQSQRGGGHAGMEVAPAAPLLHREQGVQGRQDCEAYRLA